MHQNDPINLLTRALSDAPPVPVLHDEQSWALIKEHAGRYGVAPLIAYVARHHASPGESRWCEQILLDSWKRHGRMLGHLQHVLGLLNGKGIPTISLKGPLLARRYYTPAFLRKPSMDLDLAVTEPDLGNACDVLVAAGYKQDASVRDSLTRSHHVTLVHRSKPRIELHFRLSHQALGIPVGQFFERVISCRLPNGKDAQVLGPADQLLHLILHLAHSRFGTLFHLYEIRRVCRSEPPAILEEAIQRAIEHHFCGVLQMIEIAFRARWQERFLPAEVEIPATWLNWRLNEKLYEEFESWSTPGRELTLPARLEGRWLDFQITDTPSDIVRWIMLMKHTAYFQIARRGWGTAKHLVYGPH